MRVNITSAVSFKADIFSGAFVGQSKSHILEVLTRSSIATDMSPEVLSE